MEMISATTPVISTLSVSCYVCGCAHGNVYFTFCSNEGLFILERKQLIMQDLVFENGKFKKTLTVFEMNKIYPCSKILPASLLSFGKQNTYCSALSLEFVQMF